MLDAMRSRIPGVANVEAGLTEDSRLVLLRFQDGSLGDPFIATYRVRIRFRGASGTTQGS